MFLSQTEEYSKFDEEGIPTHDKSGAELAKVIQILILLFIFQSLIVIILFF